MGKSVHLFATIALALLASVGTLLVLSTGLAQGAATLPQGFTDSQVVSGLTIFINDVGEKAWEEINRGVAGANYGWPVHEGVANDPQYVDPIFAHAYGQDGACSITGGAFYNPTTLQFPPAEYEGDYFFADFCGGWIKTFEPSTGAVSHFASGIERPIDLEVSKAGELYYLARGSTASPALVGKIGYAGS